MSAGRLRALAAASAVLFASVAAVGLTGGAGLAAAANEATATQDPYDGPHVAPGTVEAENFDTGGEGVAFSETSDLQWDIYRRTSVDIDYSLSTYWVERIDPSEWLEYTVEADSAGRYELTLRAAASSESTVDVVVDGETRLESVTIPDSDHAWQSVDAGTLSLDAGAHVVRIEAHGGDWRFDRFRLAAADAGDDETATPTPTATETVTTTASTPTTTTETDTVTETTTVSTTETDTTTGATTTAADTATGTETETEKTETETETTAAETTETETESTDTETETETTAAETTEAETESTDTETETETTEAETTTAETTETTESNAGLLKDELGSDEGPESAPSPDEAEDASNSCPAPAEVREDVEEELTEESVEAVRQDLSGSMVECLPRDLKAELGYETTNDDETTTAETADETETDETTTEETATTVDDEADETPEDGPSDPLSGLADDQEESGDGAAGFDGDAGPDVDGEQERRGQATPTGTDDGRAARDRGERGTASARRTSAAPSADVGGDRLQDTDGDGVIDSEDYAPRDASVQRRSDLTGSDDGPLGSGSKLLVLLTAAVAPLAYRQFG